MACMLCCMKAHVAHTLRALVLVDSRAAIIVICDSRREGDCEYEVKRDCEGHQDASGVSEMLLQEG